MAYIKPIRKLYYNIMITSVSVLVALAVGGVEFPRTRRFATPSRGSWVAVAGLNNNFISRLLHHAILASRKLIVSIG